MKYFVSFLLICQISFAQSDPIIDHGQRLILQNKKSEAIAYFNTYLKKPENADQQIHLLFGLAEIYILNLNYNAANSYYIRIAALLKKNKNPQLEFLYYLKMAEFYRKRGLYLQAIEKLDMANLLIKIKNIDDGNLANYYSRRAAIYT